MNEQQVNREAYRTNDALEKYSSYTLYPNEKYLFKKYFKKDSSVLDLACGAGRTTVRLHEDGYKVKGTDLSDVLIKMAIRRFPYITFEECSYTDINEEDNSWENILISHNGLDYAFPEDQREKAIKEVVRVLKPGGVFILSSHNIKSLRFSPFLLKGRKTFPFLIKNILNGFYESKYIINLGMHTFYGSPNYVISQIEKHGFKLVEMVGFRSYFGYLTNKYFSPYIHYVFVKL